MNQLSVNYKHIGMTLYPVDNSYSFEVNVDGTVTASTEQLAGNNYNASSKPCQIISGPFVRRFYSNAVSRQLTSNFVMVRYEGRIFGVLNNFTTESVEPEPYL